MTTLKSLSWVAIFAGAIYWLSMTTFVIVDESYHVWQVATGPDLWPYHDTDDIMTIGFFVLLIFIAIWCGLLYIAIYAYEEIKE